MNRIASEPSEVPQIGFVLYGVRFAVSADTSELLNRLLEALPPGVGFCETAEDAAHFRLAVLHDGSYQVQSPGAFVSASVDVEIAASVFDARLRGYLAEHAPDHTFIHAGTVGFQGQAIVLPGATFTGKTTLVAELVRAGATYYSDEYAVLDADGLAHPYARPLSIRDGDRIAIDHRVETLGGAAGAEPLPVGLVAVTQYRPGARWQPHPLSPGEAALALLANTVPAQERPAQSLGAIRRAIDGSLVLEGERGEAAEVAADLLER